MKRRGFFMELTVTKPEASTSEIAMQEPFKYYVQTAYTPEMGKASSGIMRRIVIIKPPAAMNK
jgi:hypothetical protein